MEIVYYYAAHSAFAYLGAAELKRIAIKTGATIKHKPMDLRAVMPASGSQAFGTRSKAHLEYFFGREITRWAEHRDIPVMTGMPSHHANDIHFANRLLIAADQAGLDIDRLSEEMLRAHWVDDADVASKSDLMTICKNSGIQPAPLLEAANGPDIEKIYAKNTADAVELGVFGSPTYFVGGDMFYGQDRLDMVERALLTPYKGSWLFRQAPSPEG
ncbi:MAG: 2-hydroxychromene-2-carboxylate isomerase [Sneathiella sp.]